jgi:hypothetical protein
MPSQILNVICPLRTYSLFAITDNYSAICHCPSCRKITSSAFTTCSSIPKSAIQITSGSEVLKTYTQPHGPTGMQLTIHFCSYCATTLYREAASDELKDHVQRHAGSRGWQDGCWCWGAVHELWVKYRAKWLAALPGVKHWDGFQDWACPVSTGTEEVAIW